MLLLLRYLSSQKPALDLVNWPSDRSCICSHATGRLLIRWIRCTTELGYVGLLSKHDIKLQCDLSANELQWGTRLEIPDLGTSTPLGLYERARGM